MSGKYTPTGDKKYEFVPATRLTFPTYKPTSYAPHSFGNKIRRFFGFGINPRVIMSLQAYLDMKTIIGYAGEYEVSWLGVVEKEGDILRIKEVFLFHQDVSFASTELSQDHLAEFYTKMICDGEMEKANKIKFWGHVHPGTSTSPSGQDDQQMRIFADANEWFLRGIFSKVGGRIEFCFYDFARDLEYNDIPWEVDYSNNPERQAELETQMKAYVSAFKPRVYTRPAYPIKRYGKDDAGISSAPAGSKEPEPTDLGQPGSVEAKQVSTDLPKADEPCTLGEDPCLIKPGADTTVATEPLDEPQLPADDQLATTENLANESNADTPECAHEAKA